MKCRSLDVTYPPNFYYAGVYKIIFDESYFYIGSSNNVQDRILQWKSTLSGSSLGSANLKIKNLIKTTKKIRFEILEMCDDRNCKEREDHYIKRHKDDEFFLNRGLSAYGNHKIKWIPEDQAWRARQKEERKRFFKDVPKLKSVSITRTEGEWKIISKKIEQLGKKDLSVYIRGEIWKLKNKYSECPDSISRASGKKIEKRPYITIEAFEEIQRIATKMQIPASTVINRLIISPLLTQDVSIAI